MKAVPSTGLGSDMGVLGAHLTFAPEMDCPVRSCLKYSQRLFCEQTRDKASLDIFWLKDQSLEESENLPAPAVLAAEIVEDLEAALEQFREILADIAPE
jgi:hypothetical protein